MGRVEEEILICGENGCKKIKALFDTGSDVILLNKSFADKIGIKYTGMGAKVKIADNSLMHANEGETNFIQVKNLKFPKYRVFVHENLSREVIVGNRFMQDSGIKLDLPMEKIIFGETEIYG